MSVPSPRMKVLLVIEQCNPEWPSVPLEGFRYYEALRRLADVTLVTHQRNQRGLASIGMAAGARFIPESVTISRYFRAVSRIAVRDGNVNWPILQALGYPVYAEFNRRVFRTFRDTVLGGAYDVVHVFSPILPRYPVKLIEACRSTPFILGPVNGGLPYPPGFGDIARKEFRRFRFLRTLSRVIPGYRSTYERADKILAGSSDTLAMLRQLFDIRDDRIELFHENGVVASLFGARSRGGSGGPLRLLFVGRLVPFKCADIVVNALSRLDPALQVTLSIVGDGPERRCLEDQVRTLGLTSRVSFAGWVTHEQTVDFYRRADIFCYPSIREFGGAVVLEAMAAGLPCIVPDHGCIAEYVTEKSGFRIAPVSREDLCRQMALHIETLARSEELRRRMSVAAMERASAFEWNRKAHQIVEIYANLKERKHFAARKSHV